MLTGTCHCGAITWRYGATPKTVTACNCTICAKLGVLWAYGTLDEDLWLEGPSTAYIRSDHGALEFHHCPTCGATLCWRLSAPSPEGKTQVAVNIRLADDPTSIMDIPVRHFDGLETFKELPKDHRTVKDMWF